MSKNFFPFFLECSLVEQDKVKKKLYSTLAFNEGGGLIFVRGNKFFLSFEENKEFKIPLDYNLEEHVKLSNMLGK